MAPVTQLSLVFLTTASVALAHRGHQARGARHSHKRTQPYGKAPAPYGYVNGTSASIYPTGTGAVTVTTPDVTQTRTETRTSTITEYITEESPAGAYPTGGSGNTVSGAAEGTCGGTAYVTVTDTVTVTAGSGTSSSAPAPAPATSSLPAYTSSAAAATLAPSSPAAAYQPSSSSQAQTTVVPAALPTYSAPQAYTAPAAPSSSSSSAPAAAPTSSAGGLRTKRGCLYTGNAADCSVLGETVSWSANWASLGNGASNGNVFIPQLWGHMSADGSVDFTASWAANAQSCLDNGAVAVMGYNEPDLGSQANLSPADGAALWHYVSAFEGKATIVSPSVTSRQTGTVFPGLDWLSSFQSAGANWDATGVHFYGDCTQDPSTQITYLQNMVNEAHSRFSKPVWVTEFGCNVGASVDQIASFLAVAVPYLEGETKCAQYAAFNAGLLVSGSSLNAAGSAYVSISSS